jgi:hypothetical protein
MTMLQIQVDIRYKMATNMRDGYTQTHVCIRFVYEKFCLCVTHISSKTRICVLEQKKFKNTYLYHLRPVEISGSEPGNKDIPENELVDSIHIYMYVHIIYMYTSGPLISLDRHQARRLYPCLGISCDMICQKF